MTASGLLGGCNLGHPRSFIAGSILTRTLVTAVLAICVCVFAPTVRTEGLPSKVPASPVGGENGSGGEGGEEVAPPEGSAPSGAPDAEAGDDNLLLDWDSESSRHSEDRSSDSESGVPTTSPSNSAPDAAPNPTPVEIPDFITRLERARDIGGWNCSFGECNASQTACTVAPSYSTRSGDFVATRHAHSQSASDASTYERITRETSTGNDSRDGYTCRRPAASALQQRTGAVPGGEAAPEPVVIIMTQSDFAKLPVKPSVASAGPERGWLPAGMVNVLYAEPTVQTLETELLDTPVAVRAIPTSYHWDLGDGNTITTSKPGKPYPSEEVAGKYSGEGWYDVTLTTTFAGQFSVDGGEWQDIDGTIEVESDPIELFSKSLESRLVNPDVPVDEDEDPWVPERSPDTEGPKDPEARHREI